MDENKSTQTVTETISYKKSRAVAFLLWLFLGVIGAHRYYCGKVGTGIVQLLLAVIGGFLSFIGIGFIPLIILGIWLFIDLILILTGSLVSGTDTVQRTVTTTVEDKPTEEKKD